MNGGKDFSRWSANDKAIARLFGNVVCSVLGSYGKGLVSTALAESEYEKGGDSYEVLYLLSRGEMEIASGGKFEMGFVICGIKSRLYISLGKLDHAILLLDNFKKKTVEAAEMKLMDNIEAMACRHALLNNDMEAADRWLKKMKPDLHEFYVLDRYRYFTAVQVWITREEYIPALDMLEKLRYYSRLAERYLYLIDIDLYEAMISRRLHRPWKKMLIQALESCCELKLIRPVSEKGAALKEMLEEIEGDIALNKKIGLSWYKEVYQDTCTFAALYPAWLQPARKSLVFSENAIAILRLQAQGHSARDISEMLDLKMDNVRYHIKENYRKLNVSSKAEALLKARKMNLI